MPNSLIYDLGNKSCWADVQGSTLERSEVWGRV